MGLVTFIILFGPAMEYVAPNMTPSASHVTQKMRIMVKMALIFGYTVKTHRHVATYVT